MCDWYVCPFTVVYLLLAHLFSLRICLPSHSFTSWQKTYQFFCSMKTLKLLSFILLPTNKELKNKNSLNHWDPTELLRCESISIGTDDSIWYLNDSHLMKWGESKENDLDNDKVVVYIGMFTFVHVLCWLSDFFSSPAFFQRKLTAVNTLRNLKELMTHLRTVHLYCILEPLRFGHGGSKGWTISPISTTFSIVDFVFFVDPWEYWYIMIYIYVYIYITFFVSI